MDEARDASSAGAGSEASEAVPNRPHMEAAGIARLDALMRGTQTVLEYGSGGSTMMAGQLGIPLIISTESDRLWCQKLRRQFCPTFLGSLLVSLHADLGPTQSWGHPAGDAKARLWPLYPTVGWRFVQRIGRQPDLILIDGRFRSACLLLSLSCGEPGTPILFDDYVGRDYRSIVERFARPIAFHGRMAEFVIPQPLEFPHSALALALAETLMDPN
ncbi:MAG: hypothetical protein ACT4QA_03065 [Panacagrimonas sp.]